MMKRRLIAMLLCIAMILPVIPVLAESGSGLSVYQNGGVVTSVSFPSNKTTQISAATADGCEGYQWQILVPSSGVWANIYRENSSSLVLSQALIANMVNGQNTAYVRCAQTVSGIKVYTDAVAVTTSAAVYEEVVLPAFVPAAAPVNEAEQPVQEEVLADEEGSEPVMMFALSPTSLATYTIKIDYVFEDGSLAAQSWEGTFTEGSSYNLSVTSPMVHGYVANIDKIVENFSEITEDKTFTVTYKPTQVKYVVKHWLQNTGDDNYTEDVQSRVEHNDKFANDQVGPDHSKTYTGFKTLDYDTTTAIAADGSTALNIYYDRLYYLMTFNLDGGYGVEPIYARYGTPITVGTPSKAGYSFSGWNKTIPSTMPAENTNYTANWTAGNQVNVNLVFWYENANDDGYTYVGSTTTTTAYTEGKTVTPSQFYTTPFTGRDDLHFKFNASKDTAVALNADGSTIVNIYFTRNTYRMIFFNCRQSGHGSDEASCYPSSRAEALSIVQGMSDRVNVGYDPSGAKIWGISIYTRKWQQNVRPDWEKGIAGRESTRRWMPYKVYGADGKTLIYDGTLNVSTMNIMPDADIVFWFRSTGTVKCTMNYWVTPVPGTTSSADKKVDNGITYELKDQVVTMMGGITENEEYVDIEGFTKVYTWAQLGSKGYRTSGGGWATAHFFYQRNNYNLAYISDGKTVKTVAVPFEALIKGENNQNFKPDYPSDWEPGAYEFKGWYLSETGATGTEVKWDSQKMPIGGFSIYAKWEPVVHDLKVDVYGDGSDVKHYEVVHGTTLPNPPANPEKNGYEFISWFYVDENGNEKPFTFEMPIVRELDLYPKWKQVAIVKGTVSYKLEDGTQIADDSAVEAVVGDTKTYDAKANDDLFSNYQEHYFPKEISHSITFDITEANNVYTFVYVRKDSVSYTVKYLEKGTNKVLAEEKNTTSTKAAVVENFKPIAGYLPDLYKKTLLLDADDGNELIFWYTKDSEHAPVLRGHYLENAEDDNYTTYQEILDGYGKIGETYTEAPLTEFKGTDINGFTLNEAKSTQSGTLTAAGLELKLYYDRNEYPYEFRFVDENGKTIHDPIGGEAKFEATVSQEALVIPGYELVSDEELSITVAIEDGEEAVKNVQAFTYKAALADLKITKSGANTTKDENQAFVFTISGDPFDTKLPDVNMTVTIYGNGSRTILDLPVGEYTVTEGSWSWRYTASAAAQEITLNNPEQIAELTFANSRTEQKWLSGDSWGKNLWKNNGITATFSPDK